MMKSSWILAVCAAAALAACGGGDDEPAVTEAVPASASANVDNFVGYLRQLVASSADTLEPVDVSGVTPPTDDMAPPAVVD
jgi:ABC-type glycerol-3-phosphate transport system substrate-binding protein